MYSSVMMRPFVLRLDRLWPTRLLWPQFDTMHYAYEPGRVPSDDPIAERQRQQAAVH